MIKIYKSELLRNAGFENHGFSSGLNFSFDAGETQETVLANMAAFKKHVNTQLPLAWLKQVHGSDFVEAGDLVRQNKNTWKTSAQTKGDAIISDDDRALLAVKTADCVPVLLACPSSKIIAAIHAGWRGTAKGIIRNTIKKMISMGASTGKLLAAIGPCICLKCYEVDEDVARNFPESSDPVKGKPGKFLLDMGLAVEVSLIGAGLTTKNIDRIGECTCCNKELFSHRRDGEKCGRQLAFISQ